MGTERLVSAPVFFLGKTDLIKILEEKFKNDMDFSLKSFFLGGIKSRKIEEKNRLIILTYEFSFTEKMGRFEVLNSGVVIKTFSMENVQSLSFDYLLKSKNTILLGLSSEVSKPSFDWRYGKKGELYGLKVQMIL